MYNLLAIGGTFDHLHAGHIAFLTAAFLHGKRVLIGLTSDEMAGNKTRISNVEYRKTFPLENFQTRKKHLETVLREKGWGERAEIVAIDDVYGPVVERDDVTAMVVSAETMVGARMINAKRREQGRRPLTILPIPFSLAEDRKRISSTRIRGGSIDRVGHVYGRLPLFGKKMPEGIRQRLKEPLGEVISTPELVYKRFRKRSETTSTDFETCGPGYKPAPTFTAPLQHGRLIITVGDVVTKTLNEIDPLMIDIAIIDYRVNRKAVHSSLEDVGYTPKEIQNVIVTSAKNPPGWITHALVRAVKNALAAFQETGNRQVVRVIGEEDLAGVPALLFAPLGSVVIYGQPQEGMVMVEVTEEKKKEVMNLVGIADKGENVQK